jgi:hypothetical protein
VESIANRSSPRRVAIFHHNFMGIGGDLAANDAPFAALQQKSPAFGATNFRIVEVFSKRLIIRNNIFIAMPHFA